MNPNGGVEADVTNGNRLEYSDSLEVLEPLLVCVVPPSL